MFDFNISRTRALTQTPSRLQKKNVSLISEQGRSYCDHSRAKVSQTSPVTNELMAMYYSRIFPFDLLHSWLEYNPLITMTSTGFSTICTPYSKSHDSNLSMVSLRKKNIFNCREFSFTIEPQPNREIYIRYLSFATKNEFRSAVLKRCPKKIDIGAVFNVPPKDHSPIHVDGSPMFVPEQRELIFDIDLNDYDEVRNCGCKNTDICCKCWKLMIMAIKVLDIGLREDFGFNYIAWFYSGRRGVHAWVCDKIARYLTNEGRSAISNYFELNFENLSKDTLSLPFPLHPSHDRAFKFLEPMFISHILPLSGHGLLATSNQWNQLLEKLPTTASPVSEALFSKWNCDNESTPEEKWLEIKRYLSVFSGKMDIHDGTKKKKLLSDTDRVIIEQWPILTVLKHTYPRLDLNVSKHCNHLLKSPFCVHPKTGRVCVPLQLDKLDYFNPNDVPTLTTLKKELDMFKQQPGCVSNKRFNDDFRIEIKPSSFAYQDNEYEWQNTSLKEYFEYFREKFLLPMLKDIIRRGIEEKTGREDFF